jgi:MYXO-CTERM domain-containing protein
VEDQFGANPNGNFIQFYDGATLVANLLANPAGVGFMTVLLDINDTADGNPWDGVGSTTIDVTVNSTAVGSFTKGGGGYTDNVMTMEGSTNFVGFGAAEHQFDNLQVFSSAVPEPSATLLGGLGVLALLRRRRN